MHIVFVYGTLKRGFPNFDEWMKPFEYIADGVTIDKFPLVIGGPYHSPILLDELGKGHLITGELFEVDDAGLETLDVIESVGKPNGYHRIKIEATYMNKTQNVWIYVKHRAAVDIVHNELSGEYMLDERYIPANMR